MRIKIKFSFYFNHDYFSFNSFIADSETRVDHNQAVAYQNIIANRWLGIRLEIIGSFIVLFASLFAVLGRTSIESAIVGLSISYSLQISSLLNFFVRIATEVCIFVVRLLIKPLISFFLPKRSNPISYQ